jgi:hypothetical protein
LDQGKRRDPNRLRAASEPIDLGNDPPLLVDGASSGIVDRRRVSVQWFSGTILTGLCGAALMGGAVYIALDGEANFAALPERVEAALRGTLTGNERVAQATRKTDKLPSSGESNAARHVIRISTTTRAGDREVVRVRPFVRVASNLSLTVSELSANVPKFNPARLLMDNGRGTRSRPTIRPAPSRRRGLLRDARSREHPAARQDRGLSFRARTSSPMCATSRPGPAAARAADRRKPGRTTGSTGQRLAYAAEGDIDPYAGFEARIVPENITLLPKSVGKSNAPDAWNERSVAVKKGESAATILRDHGASPDDIRALTAVLGARGRDGGLREGQKLRILFAPTPGACATVRRRGGRRQRDRSGGRALDTGKYVAVDVQSLSKPAPRWPRPRKTTRTTPRRCGSIRASTRPRCATRSRAR